MRLAFTVAAPPVGKGRPRFTRRGTTYTPKETVVYERLVRVTAQDVMRRRGIEMLSGALRMTIVARMIPPKSASKRIRAAMLAGEIRPTTKPDCSNICKGIEDALNGVAYRDDALITELVVGKVYAETTGSDVTIERIADER